MISKKYICGGEGGLSDHDEELINDFEKELEDEDNPDLEDLIEAEAYRSTKRNSRARQ